MNNVFQRRVDINSLKDKELSDYTPSELVAFLTTAYPHDPIGALQYMRENYVVGIRLGEQAALILEGMRNVKTD